MRRGWPSSVLRPESRTLPFLMACLLMIFRQPTPSACTSSSRINDDICMLKKRVDCLGSTMSQCAMNHSRLESLVRKKQVPTFMHAHPSRHTHTPHGHHHTYAHVYTCTHCGRKGHLAKFCYDRLHTSNLANNFIWVRAVSYTHLTLPTIYSV